MGISDAGARPAGISDKEIRGGLAYGLGLEVAINNGWSARIEAMNYDFGDAAESFSGSSQSVDTELRTVNIGLSRKF